jgi:hypothetical protein
MQPNLARKSSYIYTPMIDFEPLVSTYGHLEVLKWDRMGDFQAIVVQNSHRATQY